MSFGRCRTEYQRKMGERTIESLSNRLLDLDNMIKVRNESATGVDFDESGVEFDLESRPPDNENVIVFPQSDTENRPPQIDSQIRALQTDIENRPPQIATEIQPPEMENIRPPQNDSEITQAQPDMDTFEFVESMKNKNTVRKTKGDLKKFEEYLRSLNESRAVHEIEPSNLDSYMARFFLSAKRSDGREYEPDSLKSFQSSIHRYLVDKNSNMNPLEDVAFKHSRDVLTSKRKLLKQQGKGNKGNKAEVLTKEDIDVLYGKNLLGTGKWYQFSDEWSNESLFRFSTSPSLV